MLYLLTGDVQTGKTRWLTRLVEQLIDQGTTCYGVLAPGIWKRHLHESGEESFEKLGIENVLLPQQERIVFARRRDLAMQEGIYDGSSQSAQAQLGWEIDDEAIRRVNRHFDELTQVVLKAKREETSNSTIKKPGLLVVDEIGQLELLHNKGFTSVVSLLEKGPTPLYEHALVTVRDWLCDKAEERFACHWNQVQRIFPGDEAQATLTKVI